MVSIIVPVYNTEEYLGRCVESILKQSYRDIELILVDDGSTDNSLEICRKYETQDSRIIVYHKENGGQGSARNLGLDVCKGDYICFVDSDDYIDNNMIELLINNLDKYNADISCAILYSKEDRSDYKYNDTIYAKENVDAMNLFVKNIGGFNHSPCAKLFRRDVLKNVRFIELSGFEDAGTIFKAFMNAKRVVSQDVSLYLYFQRENSTMHRKFSVKDFDRITAYNEMEKGLRSKSEYRVAADIVTKSKIGAIYYVIGESLRSNIPQKRELIRKCRLASKEILDSGNHISTKNKVLLNSIWFCPRFFGLLYRIKH